MRDRPLILIVDDEPFNVQYLEQELADIGYDTVSASNGREALSQVIAESPDLVLLDIMMPIMDGFAVLSRLKALPETRDLPVIIISANNDLQSVVKGVKLGAEDYLPKPFEPILLHARIEAGLLKKRHRDQEREYLYNVELLTSAASAIESNAYAPQMIDGVVARSDALGELARVFAKMAAEVRAREQRLKNQLMQLQLDIEQQKLAKAETISTYIPMDRRQAMAQGRKLPQNLKGAALFADISGFTTLTESLAAELGFQRGAEEILRILNRVYGMLIDLVHDYRGSVINFSGDAITCWFDDVDLAGASYPISAAERAAACALSMQSGMREFVAIPRPDGKVISLSLKVAVACGSARRMLLGEGTSRYTDVLAGRTLEELSAAEHAAGRGEVIFSVAGFPSLDTIVIVSEWRQNRQYALITGMMRDVPTLPWPALPQDAISEEDARPWMLPAVFEKVRAGKSDMLSELRNAVALFVQFTGIDYDSDPNGPARLDAYIQWVERVVSPFDGAVLQVIVGDKGSYLYIVFGAPVAHHDDALRAISSALQLADLPDDLHFISSVQIGIASGLMRVGAYGGATHRTYGVIGDRTNLAARLMQAATPAISGTLPVGRAAILCDENVYEAVRSQVDFYTLAPIWVKGKDQPVAIYQPLAIFVEPVHRTPLQANERAQRMDHLPPTEQLVLKVASVIVHAKNVQTFALELLKAVYPDRGDLLHIDQALNYLVQQDLIVRRTTAEVSYSFKDPLIRDAAYNRMLFAQRRQLHRALAELLEQNQPVEPLFAEIARHWQAADDLPRAAQFFEKAGEYARSQGNFEMAAYYLTQSLNLAAPHI